MTMTNHHEELSNAVDEVLDMLPGNEEPASILREALGAHGYRRTAVPGQPVSVGICSACGDDVMRRAGQGARCPCGATIIPETFIARMPGGDDAA